MRKVPLERVFDDIEKGGVIGAAAEDYYHLGTGGPQNEPFARVKVVMKWQNTPILKKSADTEA